MKAVFDPLPTAAVLNVWKWNLTFLLGENFSDGGTATVAGHGDVKFALSLQIRK